MSEPKINLPRLKELDAKATKGPWGVHPNPRYYVLLPGEVEGDPNRDNNAELVAVARTELPRLVAWASAIVENLTGILCERDDGAPTPRNLELAKLLSEIEVK